MANHSYDDVMTALRNADSAGDTEGATRLAQIASGMKSKNESLSYDKKPQEQSFLSKAANMLGVGEAGLNMATGMIAKPVSDIAGLAATGKEMMSPTYGGGDPSGFKRHVQESMTYEPRTELGKNVAEYNPVSLAGKAVGKVADVAGNAVSGDNGGQLRQAAGNFTREAIQQAPGLIGARNLGKSLPAKVLSPEEQAVVKAQSKGYALPPSIGRPNALNEFIDGHILGKAKSEQGASMKSQKINDSMVKESFGLPEGEPITAEALETVRSKAGASYEGIKKAIPSIIADKEYLTSIKDIVGNKYKEAVKEFPNQFKNKDIEALQSDLNRPRMTTDAAIELVKSLRAKSRINKGPNKTVESDALGNAQINGANAIEALMAKNLKSAGQPELYQQMLDARRTIAQTYVVENALSGRGSISARAIAKAADKAKKNGVLFTGELADIAENYKNFPKAMQDMNKVGISPPGSPLTSAAAGHALLSGHPLVAGLVAAKGGLRPLVMSDWYQRNFASPPKPGPRNPSSLNYGLIPPPPADYDRSK